MVMENNNKKSWMNIQLFGDGEGAQTPNEGGPQDPTQQGVNFEEQCKRQAAEIEKLKAAISKTNSENANYKKKEMERMSDEERKAKEIQDILARNDALEAELKTMKQKQEILDNGFTSAECEKLMKGNLSIKDFAEILKARLEENTKSVTAGLVKQTTPATPKGDGIGSANAPTKTAFQLRQESQTRAKNKVEL